MWRVRRRPRSQPARRLEGRAPAEKVVAQKERACVAVVLAESASALLTTHCLTAVLPYYRTTSLPHYSPLTTHHSLLTTHYSLLQAAYAQMDKLKLAAKAEMARQRAQMAQQHSLVVAKLRGQPAGTGGDTPQPRAAVTPPTGLRQGTHGHGGDMTDGGANVSAHA